MIADQRMTADQRRARRAAQLVLLVRDDEKLREAYRSRVKAMPALIHQCGLLQALAFLAGKAETDVATDQPREADETVLYHLQQMLESARLAKPGRSLVVQYGDAGLVEYHQATREAVAALAWLGRLGEAAGFKGPP